MIPPAPQTPVRHRRRRAAAFSILALVGAAGCGGLGGLEGDLSDRIDHSAAEVVGVYFRNLETGDSLLIDADVRMHAASTMKVPLMIQVFRDADAAWFALEDSVPITATFQSIADGSPYRLDRADDSDSTLYERVGGRATLRELTELMITVSSNLATNILIGLVGPGRVQHTMARLGADSIAVLRGVEDGPAFRAGMNNTTTARDLGVILTAIAADEAASAAACAAMRDILARQRFNEGIPAGLPSGTRVAHKTGWITGIAHDAAIVEPEGGPRYILVVLTRGIEDGAEANGLIADLSRMVYESLTP